jgi:hypothetical protein
VPFIDPDLVDVFRGVKLLVHLRRSPLSPRESRPGARAEAAQRHPQRAVGSVDDSQFSSWQTIFSGKHGGVASCVARPRLPLPNLMTWYIVLDDFGSRLGCASRETDVDGPVDIGEQPRLLAPNSGRQHHVSEFGAVSVMKASCTTTKRSLLPTILRDAGQVRHRRWIGRLDPEHPNRPDFTLWVPSHRRLWDPLVVHAPDARQLDAAAFKAFSPVRTGDDGHSALARIVGCPTDEGREQWHNLGQETFCGVASWVTSGNASNTKPASKND